MHVHGYLCLLVHSFFHSVYVLHAVLFYSSFFMENNSKFSVIFVSAFSKPDRRFEISDFENSFISIFMKNSKLLNIFVSHIGSAIVKFENLTTNLWSCHEFILKKIYIFRYLITINNHYSNIPYIIVISL